MKPVLDWQALASAQAALFQRSAHDFHGLVQELRRATEAVVDCDRGGNVLLSCRIVADADDPLAGFRVLIVADHEHFDFSAELERFRKSEAYVEVSGWILEGLGTPRAALRSETVSAEVLATHPALARLRDMGIQDALYGVCPVNRDVEVVVSVHSTSAFRFGPDQRAQMLALMEHIGPVARRLALSYGRPPQAVLSPRQRQTLSWLLRGHSEKQISAELGLSTTTIYEYVRGVYRKLEVTSRAELMALWLDA